MKRISAAVFVLLMTTSAFAGKMVSLPLTQEKAQAGLHSCIYSKEINMGAVSGLKPFQVYSLFEGSYHLITRPISLLPNSDGTFTLRLFAYQEVKQNETCPSNVEQMVLQ